MGNTVPDATYFGRNVRDPVRFASAVRAMMADGLDAFVEIAPHPVLSSAIVECAPEGLIPFVLPSLRRGRSEHETILTACAGLFMAGLDIAWKEIQPSGRVVELPSYAWQRKRYWIRARRERKAILGPATHPLLGKRILTADVETEVFESDSRDAPSWLADHRILGMILMPGAALIEMLTVAAAGSSGIKPVQLTNFVIHRPLAVPEGGDGPACWQTVVRRGERVEVAINNAELDKEGKVVEWSVIASATGEAQGALHGIEGVPAARALSAEAAYTEFRKHGAEFGPAFRRLCDVKVGIGYAEAWVQLPDNLSGSSAAEHVLHPVLIDAALQLCPLIAGMARGQVLAPELLLPLGADRIIINTNHAIHGRLLARARTPDRANPSVVISDVSLETAAGDIVMLIEGMRFAPATRNDLLIRTEPEICSYQVKWHPAPNLESLPSPNCEGDWLLFADSRGVADRLAAEIIASGGRCLRVRAGKSLARVTEDAWDIDPTSPEQFKQLLRSVDDGSSRRLRGVVHCWSADLAPFGTDVEEQSLSPDLIGPGSAMHAAQALLEVGLAAVSPLYLLTCCAQLVTGREPVSEMRPRAGALSALARTIAIEHPELPVRAIDLDAEPAGAELLRELIHGTEACIALRGPGRWAPRLERLSFGRDADSHRGGSSFPEMKDIPVRAELVRTGTDGIEFRPCPVRVLGPNEVRLRVSATGLNFRDVLLALGLYPDADVPPLGAECAGVISEVGSGVEEFVVGQRVFGLAAASLGVEAVTPAAFVAPIPAAMPETDAAAIPVAFLTAHFGLSHLAHLRPGERVLIHAATGGVGLAGVALAQRIGAEVFATAGSDSKRSLLRSLGVSHVMDSRSTVFADEILEVTKGEGVDVVLNSLSGEFIASSLRALGRGGRFLEIGKRGIWSTEAVAAIRPDVCYRVYDLGAEMQAEPSLLRPMLDQIIAAIAEGRLRPLPVTQFALKELPAAMRYMARAQHVGKIVLGVSTGSESPAITQVPVGPDSTYLITGGFGALGLETARWLVDRGARHIVLMGRTLPDADSRTSIHLLEQLGATVRTIAADAADRGALQRVLDDIRDTLPPLRGVVHAAGVVRDAVLLRQRWDTAQDVFRGKVEGAWLLHQLTRDIPLDFFILYSAAAAVLGGPGQGLYPAANAALDALARARRTAGLPALSVAWGPWAGAGMAAELASRGTDVWRGRGLGKISPVAGFAELARLMAENVPYGAILPIRWGRFLLQKQADADRDFFLAVTPRTASERHSTQTKDESSILAILRAVPSGQRRNRFIGYLSSSVLDVIGLAPGTLVDPDTPLKEMGLDSLMAVELRTSLMRCSEQPLPATLAFDYPTLNALADHLGGIWNLDLDPGDPKPTALPSVPVADAVADLSEQEAEALLLQELAAGSSGARQ